MISIDRRDKYKQMGKSQINKSNKVIDINFDLESLNLMCLYIVSENASVRRSHLINMRNLFNALNMNAYINDESKIDRVRFITKGLDARLDANLKNPYLIIKYINGGLMDDNIIDLDNLNHKLSNEEILWIDKTISDSLNYSFMYNNIKNMRNIITKFESEDYSSKSEAVNEYKEFIKQSNNSIRQTRIEDKSEAIFSLKEDGYAERVKDVHDELTAPSSMLYTGMQGLNEMFGGGLYSGRTYMFFGLSGGGKSITLLQLAYQIKKYNKKIKTKDPSKRPCIVLLTQENTVKESVERLFNMTVTQENIRNFDADEVYRRLKQDGELYLNDESPIDIIIKYKPSKSIDTTYMYTLVEDLEDEGYECILFIHDYIKHIRSAYAQSDIRLELGQVAMEYKTFAALKDVPFLGVSQLNRDGARTIDAAAENNKSDLTRLLGRSNVGESMLMIENLDWAGIINIERDYNGILHMVYKRIKIRYKSSQRDYICQPFKPDSTIALMEDLFLDIPIFKESLAMPREGIMKQGMATINRRIVSNGNRNDINDILKTTEKTKSVRNIFEGFSSSKSLVKSNLFEPFKITG